MATKGVPLGSLDIQVDEDTGAILAKLSGTIQADMITADVTAIVTGIAGTKTQKDLDDSLALILAKLPTSPALAGEAASAAATVVSKLNRVTQNLGVLAETVDVPGTAQPLSGTELLVTFAMVIAKKQTGSNAGAVYLGGSGVDKDSLQTLPLSNVSDQANRGETYQIPVPPGGRIDLNQWYIDADVADDGVVVLYTYEA